MFKNEKQYIITLLETSPNKSINVFAQKGSFTKKWYQKWATPIQFIQQICKDRKAETGMDSVVLFFQHD